MIAARRRISDSSRLALLRRKSAAVLAYARARVWPKSAPRSRTVQFYVGYQGRTGGSEAVCRMANLFSTRLGMKVFLDAGPTSDLNTWLHPSVLRGRAEPRAIDLIVCDRSAKLPGAPRSRSSVPPVICTVHGFRQSLHRLSDSEAMVNIEGADIVHFVSNAQAGDFHGAAPRHFVLPNSTDDLSDAAAEHVVRSDIGMVGYLANAHKNLHAMLVVSEAAPELRFGAWGTVPDGIDLPANVEHHGYSADKAQIFGSFRVFLSLSLNETFAMVVAQALSAGRPCVLSDIPAHREYGDAPGVFLVDPEDTRVVVDRLGDALELAAPLRATISAHWRGRFSDAAVAAMWKTRIAELLATESEPRP